VIEIRPKTWAEYVASIGEMINDYNSLGNNSPIRAKKF
jgi:hypothetical protein